jgi:hypothetical protein
MRLRLLLALSVVLALGVGVSGALAGEGSPPNPRKLCTKGHWQQLGFKSEDKCLNALQSAQQDCKSVEGTFGADNQTTFFPGAKVLWTCNGDGVTDDFAVEVLFPDCFFFGNAAGFTSNGTQGDPAMTCARN